MSYTTPKVRIAGAIEFLVQDFTIKSNSQHKMIFNESGEPIPYIIIKFKSDSGKMVGATIVNIEVAKNSTGNYERVKYHFEDVIPSSFFSLRRI